MDLLSLSDKTLLWILSTLLTAFWICQILSLVCFNLVRIFLSIDAFELPCFVRKLDVDLVSWSLT